MVKSILINDNVHKILVDKQYLLLNAGTKFGISELAEKVIINNIENFVTEFLDNKKEVNR